MFYTHQPVGVRPISLERDSYLFWSDGGSVLTEWNLRQFFQRLNPNWFASPFASHLATRITALSPGGLPLGVLLVGGPQEVYPFEVCFLDVFPQEVYSQEVSPFRGLPF